MVLFVYLMVLTIIAFIIIHQLINNNNKDAFNTIALFEFVLIIYYKLKIRYVEEVLTEASSSSDSSK